MTDRTARTDLQSLVRLGLMSEVALNNRMMGYMRSDNFDNIIKELRKGK